MNQIATLAKLFEDSWKRIYKLTPEAALNMREGLEELFLQAQNEYLERSIEQQKITQEKIKSRYTEKQVVPDAQIKGKEYKRKQTLLDIKARTSAELEKSARDLLEINELTEETDKDLLNAIIVELRNRGKHETADQLRVHFWEVLNIDEPWKGDKIYKQSEKMENEMRVWKNHLSYNKAYMVDWNEGKTLPVSSLFSNPPNETIKAVGADMINNFKRAEEIYQSLAREVEKLVER